MEQLRPSPAAAGSVWRIHRRLLPSHGPHAAALADGTFAWPRPPCCWADGTLSLAGIARQLGFADRSHLSRRFASHHGVTPSAWRDRTARRTRHSVTDRPAQGFVPFGTVDSFAIRSDEGRLTDLGPGRVNGRSVPPALRMAAPAPWPNAGTPGYTGSSTRRQQATVPHAMPTVLLLLASNCFMTWPGTGISARRVTPSPLIVLILLSWLIALPEYCLAVPANRSGHIKHGGPFTAPTTEGHPGGHLLGRYSSCSAAWSCARRRPGAMAWACC